MTTDAFLAAFRRFSSRRGQCTNIYSDNGTNFIGAARHLEKEVIAITNQRELQDSITNLGTQWHFIPPASPHLGGIWEAGVKSMKFHLKRVIGEATLTYEELTTLTCQIEACLNSRPLCPLSEDFDDHFVLTPGHFLIGKELVSPPDPIEANINSNLSQRWRLIQKIKKDFWSNWCSEYLSRLQQRYKWTSPQINLQPGTMVIIKDSNITPSQWPLARITEVQPGKDGIVRVVTVRRSAGALLKRSIHGLIPLPLDPEESKDNFSTPSRVRLTTHTTRGISKSSIFHSILLCLALTVTSCKANLTIHYPKEGFYIEHLGSSKINRGVFRIEQWYNQDQIRQNIENCEKIVTNFKQLCDKTRLLSEETRCETLSQHLQEQHRHLSGIQSTLNNALIRQKRGLLGKFLTSVFGVNEEVYQDIESLNKNQDMLIKTTNHQTKFMLSALSTFNMTENRIANQLQRFQAKLNQGLEAIDSMNRWFSKIDTNQLNIHILSTYQIATNYIAENSNHYSRILDVQFSRGTLFDVMSPAHVKIMIDRANQKLPNNLRTLSSPLLRTTVTNNGSHIQISGYFPITGTSDFVLMQATPIPLIADNGSYWSLDITSDYIAVDYDTQEFFQLTQDELSNCVAPFQYFFICSPTAVRNLETNPSCIMDELFQRPEGKQCHVKKHTIRTILWKQLYTPNTWMFITSSSAHVAIICSGVRDEVTIQSTGIIQISEDCVLKTKQVTLTPKRSNSLSVVASYSKSVALLINNTERSPSASHDVPTEPVIGLSEGLDNLKNDETLLQDQLHNITRYTIRQHASITSAVITIIIMAVVIICWITVRTLLPYYQQRRSNTRRHQNQESSCSHDAIELQSLRSSIFERGQNV